MELVWLELTSVRSYSTLRFEPDPGINVLVGPNGAGKTTILESVGYLASLSSFRRSPDVALVSTGADSAVIRGGFRSEGRDLVVEIEIPAAGRRRSLLNAKRATRAELIELLPTVAFLPDDLDLVKRGPAYRRDYLDDLAAGLWPVAGAEQRDYERALAQRNALLRKHGHRADAATLDVWDARLATLGATVIGRRMQVLGQVVPSMTELLAELGDGDRIGWEYQAGGLGPLEEGDQGIAESLAEGIAAARIDDMERRTTTVGPHRDEVVFTLDDRDVRQRASQGEQRSVALAMRVAAYEALHRRHGFSPLLLLDDVFSELDAGRSDRLVARLPGGQVLVSSARRDEVPLSGVVWRVEGSRVERDG